MSEEGVSSKTQQRSLLTVLHHCIGSDPKLTEDLAFVLRDDNVLTKDERKAIVQLVRDGKQYDAILKMISAVAKTKQGMQYFVTALQDDELNVDKRVSEVLSVTLDGSANETKIKLVTLWEVLVTFQQEVKPSIEQSWPAVETLTEDPWPLQFIHFCVTSPDDDLHKVEDFVADVAFLSPQAIAAPQGGNAEPNDMDVTSGVLQEQALEDAGHSSDDMESFFIVNEEEEGDDVGETAPPPSEAQTSVEEVDQGRPDEHLEDDTEKTDPLLASTASEAAVNQQIEEALKQDSETHETRIPEETPPAANVSEDSSLINSSELSLPRNDMDKRDTLPPRSETDSTVTVQPSESAAPAVHDVHEHASPLQPEPQHETKHENVRNLDDSTVTIQPSITTPSVCETDVQRLESSLPSEPSQENKQTEIGNPNVQQDSVVTDQPNETKSAIHELETQESANVLSTEPPQENKQTKIGNRDVPDSVVTGQPNGTKPAIHELEAQESANLLSTEPPQNTQTEVRNPDFLVEPAADEDTDKATGASLPANAGQQETPEGSWQPEASESLRTGTNPQLFPPHINMETSLDSGDKEWSEYSYPSVDMYSASDVVEQPTQVSDPGISSASDSNADSDSESNGEADVPPTLHSEETKQEISQDNNDTQAALRSKIESQKLTTSPRSSPAEAVSGDESDSSDDEQDTDEDFDRVDSNSLVLPPDTESQNVTSDGDLADLMNLETTIRRSQGQDVLAADLPRVKQSASGLMSDFFPTTHAEFRVVFSSGQRKLDRGWQPFLTYDKKKLSMHRSKSGYYYVTVNLSQDSTIKYCYVLEKKKNKKRRAEYLPKGAQRVRKILKNIPGRIVVHDVAYVKKSVEVLNEKIWEDSVRRHIKDLLSAPEDIAQHTTSYSAAEEVWFWICCMKTGWRTTSNYHFVCKQETFDAALDDWLDYNNGDSSNSLTEAYGRVKRSIAVIDAIYKSVYTIRNAKLLSSICKGFEIHGLNEAGQRQLFGMIAQTSKYNKELLRDSLHYFFKHFFLCEKFADPACVLAIPFYWLVCSDGEIQKRDEVNFVDLLYNRAMLPNLGNISWDIFRSKIWNRPDGLKKLRDLCEAVQQAASVHPWFADTFQYFLTPDCLIEIMTAQASLAEKLSIDSVFSHVLPQLDPENRRKVAKLSGYFRTRFKTLYDAEAIMRLDLKRRENAANRACHVLEVLKTALRCTVEANIFDKSEVSCIQWLLTMACDGAKWFDALQMGQSVVANKAKAVKFSIIALVIYRINEYKKCGNKVDVAEIEFYNNLLNKQWGDAEFRGLWCNKIQETISQVVDEQWHRSEDAGMTFFNFYLITLKDVTLSPRLESILEKKANEFAGDAFAQTDLSSDASWLCWLVQDNSDRSVKIFANAFTREFAKFHNEESQPDKFTLHVLKFLVESPFATRFYRAFAQESVKKRFSGRDYQNIMRVHSVAENFVGNTPQKNITVEELDLMLHNRRRVIEILTLVCRQKIGKRSPITEGSSQDKELDLLFESLDTELKHYKQEIQAIEYFMNLCGSLGNNQIHVNCTKLKKIHGRKDSVLQIGDMHTSFIGNDKLEEILRIARLKESRMFFPKVADVAHRLYDELPTTKLEDGIWKTDWIEVLDTIVNKAYTELLEFLRELDEGSLSLENLTAPFKFTDGDEEKLKAELLILYKFSAAVTKETGNARHIERKAGKMAGLLTNAFKMQQNLETIKWFENFRKRNNLTGDFGVLDNFEHEAFQRLDGKEFKKLRGIVDIDRKHLKVLQAFSKEEDLVKWLQTKMKDEGQVRGLCLVAVESTRHDPKEADKWSFLSDAVAAFDQLIFRLNEITSLEILLERCANVWRKVGEDKSVRKKWSDVAKDLDWYKEHEQWYGSEEKAALHFAQTVNMHGIYTVGNFTNIDSNAATLENSIKLELSRQRHEGTSASGNGTRVTSKVSDAFPKDVGIDYLHEVEAKLMLIANDSDGEKTEIKQFVRVLNAVESLAKAYVDLVNAGFMLLSNWTAVASSSKSNDTDLMTEHIMTLKITFKDGVPPLARTVSIQDVNLLSDIMRDALTRWNKHMSRMRLKHYFLDDYNIQQIKYLCGQLLRVRQGALEEQAYLLLSDLQRSIMTPIILESLNEAMTINEQDDSNQDEELVENEPDVSKELAEVRNKRRAVRHLVNRENTTEALAKAAVQAEGYEDLTNCCNWILLNEYDDEVVTELSRAFDQNAGFVYEQTDIQEDVTVLQNRSAKTLEAMIKVLQQKAADMGSDLLEAVKTIFVGYQNNTTTLTLKDCLSVSHLGRFLTILHKKMEEKAPSPVRQLPDTFRRGVPNFILTEKHGTIPLVLSLYADSLVDEPTGLPPLPTSTEVLLCGEDTAADEVERFMQQAVCKHPHEAHLIFCLIFTERLNFNVSKALEDIFHKLSHDEHASDNYQLVITSNDRHHYVTNCFDKYQVEKSLDVDENTVQSYIRKHMRTKTILGRERVSVVSSERSGVGKSLHVKRVMESLKEGQLTTTVRLLEKNIQMNRVIERLHRHQAESENPQLVHIDLTPAVENGIEKFIFDLLVLGLIKDSSGNVWRKLKNHSYIIEVTKQPGYWQRVFSHTLELLPTTMCVTPTEVLRRIQDDQRPQNILLMDEGEYLSDTFQRPYQYLLRHENNEDMAEFNFAQAKDEGKLRTSEAECLEVLLRRCGIKDPSWAQLKHFVSFLDIQLSNCEKSAFCLVLGNELQGLKEFAVKFMIRMAQDFATPSLVISDESGKNAASQQDSERDVLQDHQIRRRWEENEHPYVFFNEDGVSMTFINVNIDKNGDLLGKDGNVVEKAIASKELVRGLKRQEMELGYNFHELTREQMLLRLCLVMGIELPPDPNPASKKRYEPKPYDPDTTYELTTDNVLKMIAIYMRFRCNIPVIIMGETGCGKTRMIEFMSRLQAGPSGTGANMKTLKIHGGIGIEDIFQTVRKPSADEANREILFYDEANTTTAIYAIKEVMCDLTIDGEPLPNLNAETPKTSKLQIVAACNPYKQLSPEALKKLESSGLGYRVATEETCEKLGNIAMRTLVYRVVPLPPSILPFVWDFGQLSDETEMIYISKMVASKLQEEYTLSYEDCDMIVKILYRAHTYMKAQKNECRYVSLRDVERTIKLYGWFNKHSRKFFPKMDDALRVCQTHNRQSHPQIDKNLRCLLHAIGISYYVSLENREKFRVEMSRALYQCEIPLSQYDLLHEYNTCQKVFHRDLKSEDNIAWNEALRENVFLMAVCADVKLPLYLIGKPGSSKSLAKSIVEANMKGPSSNSPLFKKLKKVEVLSYQCSALTRASGVKKIFQDASARQKDKDLDKFTAMVVLDEIGLAEDSPNMPLKILHPLLECGNADSGTLTEYKESEKVAFVGISNWALDPAKMNRGIFVTRSTPNETDLFTTAQSIFHGNYGKVNENHTLLETLTRTYLGIYKKQGDQYFGLRDYYCLIKMIRSMCEKNQKVANQDIAYVLVRNFSGGKEKHVRALTQSVTENLNLPENFRSQTSLKCLITDNIKSMENRFLLLLTAQHSSVSLLRYVIPGFDEKVQVIFGSSFPGDHTYTEICKNINRIKMCMELGKLVVLLNMTEIHESLYDVLNQHYVRFGGQRYVAIGLGSHRVWSRVHEDFRIIVIEKMETVQNQYPIPLINRLEKHHLLSKSLLTPDQLSAAKSLSKWSRKFAKVDTFSLRNAFIGSHQDTASSVVLAYNEDRMDTHKRVMLQAATADSLYRLSKSKLSMEKDALMLIYMEEQVHDCLCNLLNAAKSNLRDRLEIFEVFSFSNILTEEVRKEIELKLNLIQNSVMLLSLQQFKIEEEYTKKLDDFLTRCLEAPKKHIDQKRRENVTVLIIQTSQAHAKGKLIECAKHNFMNKIRDFPLNEMNAQKMIVVFVLSMGRCVQSNGIASEFTTQHTRNIRAVYIDELRHSESNSNTTLINSFYKKNVGEILQDGVTLLESGNSMNSHIFCLLQDCISEAMSKVTSSSGNGGRQLERIRALKKLCATAGSELEVGHGFLKILLQKMKEFQRSESEKKDDKLGWIEEEACSQERLQEGGTFGKTIHLSLKHRLADMLAFVVSVIDENNNIGILLSIEKGMEWRLELWLRLFSVIQLRKPTREQPEYSVKTVQHLNMKPSCEFPFSFLINEKLLRCFEDSQQTDAKEEYFYKAIEKENQKELAIVWKAWGPSNCMKMMEAYAHDLIKFQFKTGANCEAELLATAKILFEYSKKRWTAKGREVNGVAITFCTFMEITDHLSVLSSVFKICPDVMDNVNTWIAKDNEGEIAGFHIHEYALNDLLLWANQKAGKIEDEKSCIEWMHVSSQIRKTYQGLVDSIKQNERKAELQGKWKPIALLDMMLTHLLPWDRNDRDYSKYAGLVVVQAKRLFKAMERMGFHSKEVLKIVTTIIRKSYEDLELSLIMQWKTPICVCGKRIQTPIQMPCGGFICSRCFEMMQQESRICPLCTETLPEEFQNARPKSSPADIKRLKNFQASCSGFFLEYLNEFCFASLQAQDNAEDNEKIRAIFEDTLLETQLHSSTPTKMFKLETTKLDLNVTVKSSIFQLLLRLRPSLVETRLDEILNDRFKDDILIMAVLKGLENICAEEAQEQGELEYSHNLLRASWQYLTLNQGKLLTFDGLQHVARMRYALGSLVKCVEQRRLSPREDEVAPALILAAINIMALENSQTLRKFITKAGGSMYGHQWWRQIQEIEQYKVFIHPDVEIQLDDSPDYWEILGEDYKTSKPARQTNEVPLKLENLPKIMANLHGNSATIFTKLGRKLWSDEENVLQKWEHLKRHLLSVPALSEKQANALYQLVLLVVGTVVCKLPLATELHKLIVDPDSTTDMFWPGMPEPNYLQMNEAMDGEAAYACPNGHVYYIGDCTFPWTRSYCPVQDCGELIGGFLHKEAPGNQRLQTNRDLQCGYQLHGTTMGVDKPSDRITEQAAAVIQFFVHSCMIIALKGKRTQMLKIIDKEDVNEAYEFLADKLHGNLIELAHGLGCNVDDAILVFHQVLARMTTAEHEGENCENLPDWSSKESRKTWEKEFRERYLVPIFQEADEYIIEAKQKLEHGDNLNRLLQDDVTFESTRARLTCFHPVLWRTMREPTAPHLLHCIADSSLPGGVLRTILQTTNLHLVKYLGNALKLQEMLIQRYQNKCEMKDVENTTFKQIRAGEMIELIEDYIKLWNWMLPSLLAKYRSRKILSQHMRKMDINSPITMALPSARGRGRCAKLLVEELIDIQNDFLHSCKRADNSIDEIPAIEVTKLQPSHVVCVNKQQDLLPMIHLHTAYSITTDEQGRQHHRISYNIGALEKQAKERHVVYKKIIKRESLPCIKYAQDAGSDWDKVDQNVHPQLPLPASVGQEIDEKVRAATLADVCEGVRTLTQAISFLAKVKIPEEEANRKLRDYMETDLMVSTANLTMIPKSTTIRHTLALYQKLSCHKAVLFVQQGLDPYKECLQDVEQGKIANQDVLRELKEAFQHMDLDSLQQHLNEMLIKTPDFNPCWSLIHIVPELTFIEENPNDSWYNRIPIAVCFGHVSDLFRLSVEGIDL